MDELKKIGIASPLTGEWKKKKILELGNQFQNFFEKNDLIYLNEKTFNDSKKLRKCITEKTLGTKDAFFSDSKVYDLMIDYRNKCAHNVHTYMKYLPTIQILQDPIYRYVNFFFFFFLISITDYVFMELYKTVFDNMLPL